MNPALRIAPHKLALLALLYLFALLSGCTSHPTLEPTSPGETRNDLSNPYWVKQMLYSQYDQWKAVKYKAGGLSREGVDCSGFVYLTYDARLGIRLPRSTDEQVNIGIAVEQQDLLPGDLVFFRTGKSTRHVGIYLEQRKFLHASTEKGVMISSLDDQYWSRTYWKSVRIKTAPLASRG